MSKDSGFKKSGKTFKKAQKGGEIVSHDSKENEAVLAQPLEVRVYNNNFDKALRAFRALVQKERILSAYKERQTYEKPSQKRRRKRNEMKRKIMELNSNKPRSSSRKDSQAE
jgi:small subunit ribosomal protein S21